MCGGVVPWSCVVWAVWVWAGLGGLPRGRPGWLVLWFPACVVGAGVVGLSGAGMRDTPVLLLLPGCVLGVGVGGCPRVLGVRGGGMLSGFWGSAPWLPGPSGAPRFFVGVLGGCGWVGCELYSGREHLTVCFLRQVVLLWFLLFVFLSVRWMPWHQGPMKDVVACDIPRGAGWRAVIRGFPNGGTRHELCRVTCI